MRQFSKRLLGRLTITILFAGVAANGQQTGAKTPATAALDFPTVLYGAAYYNEYMPGDQAERLD